MNAWARAAWNSAMLARGEAPKSMKGASFSRPTAAGVRVALTTSTM
jgi:hypothetical protein